MLSNCGARKLLRLPWTARRSNQSVLKEIFEYLNIHWKDWCWSWSSNTLATWCKELTHWKRPWCWGRLRAGGEGDDRGWDDWMASLTQWVWVWANSGRQERTGKPGVLYSMGSQRVRQDLATEWQQLIPGDWSGTTWSAFPWHVNSMVSMGEIFVQPWWWRCRLNRLKYHCC